MNVVFLFDRLKKKIRLSINFWLNSERSLLPLPLYRLVLWLKTSVSLGLREFLLVDWGSWDLHFISIHICLICLSVSQQEPSHLHHRGRLTWSLHEGAVSVLGYKSVADVKLGQRGKRWIDVLRVNNWMKGGLWDASSHIKLEASRLHWNTGRLGQSLYCSPFQMLCCTFNRGNEMWSHLF